MAGVAPFCDRGNEHLVCVKGGEFDDLQGGRRHRVKDSAPHSCLIVLCVSAFVYETDGLFGQLCAVLPVVQKRLQPCNSFVRGRVSEYVRLDQLQVLSSAA